MGLFGGKKPKKYEFDCPKCGSRAGYTNELVGFTKKYSWSGSSETIQGRIGFICIECYDKIRELKADGFETGQMSPNCIVELGCSICGRVKGYTNESLWSGCIFKCISCSNRNL